MQLVQITPSNGNSSLNIVKLLCFISWIGHVFKKVFCVFFVVFWFFFSLLVPQVEMQGFPSGTVACWFSQLPGTSFSCKQMEGELQGDHSSSTVRTIFSWQVGLYSRSSLLSFWYVLQKDVISGGKWRST